VARLLSIVRRALKVTVVAGAVLAVPFFVVDAIPGTMWTPLKPLLCGSGQDLQTQVVRAGRGAMRDFMCVAPDGTTHDVSLTVYGSMYGFLWVALWVTGNFLARKGREMRPNLPRRLAVPRPGRGYPRLATTGHHMY
jgi:hypothetical protein